MDRCIHSPFSPLRKVKEERVGKSEWGIRASEKTPPPQLSRHHEELHCGKVSTAASNHSLLGRGGELWAENRGRPRQRLLFPNLGCQEWPQTTCCVNTAYGLSLWARWSAWGWHVLPSQSLEHSPPCLSRNKEPPKCRAHLGSSLGCGRTVRFSCSFSLSSAWSWITVQPILCPWDMLGSKHSYWALHFTPNL